MTRIDGFATVLTNFTFDTGYGGIRMHIFFSHLSIQNCPFVNTLRSGGTLETLVSEHGRKGCL